VTVIEKDSEVYKILLEEAGVIGYLF